MSQLYILPGRDLRVVVAVERLLKPFLSCGALQESAVALNLD
jgi:hypothetical protein